MNAVNRGKPRIVVQCAVATTPAATGPWLARRRMLLHPPARAVFRFDKLGAILLQLPDSVKRYLVPLLIAQALCTEAQCLSPDTVGEAQPIFNQSG